MAKNQLHGKTFEGLIKSCDMFSSMATDRSRSPTALFDINKADDLKMELPTSVKSASFKSNGTVVGLSDARNFHNSFDEAPFRILIALYRQEAGKKVLFTVHEFKMQKHDREKFFGTVSLEEIEHLHFGIGTGKFPKGFHTKAREWAKSEKKKLSERLGILILNPKIDSKTQRRLQCSVKLNDLISKFSGSHTEHVNEIGGISLPFSISSTQREF